MTRSDDVRDAVLDAAKAGFRARGYLGTTMKGVAAAAGVAPDVLKRYYDNKDSLFAAAMRLPFDPATAVPTLLAPGLEGMGERLVRFTLDTLGDPEAREDLMALFQAGQSTAKAAGSLKDFLESSVIDKLAGFIGVPDARMRVALISSYLVGIAASRYVLRTEPLASAPEEQVIRMVAPTIQALLDPSVPLPGSKPKPKPEPKPEHKPEPKSEHKPEPKSEHRATPEPEPGTTTAPTPVAGSEREAGTPSGDGPPDAGNPRAGGPSHGPDGGAAGDGGAKDQAGGQAHGGTGGAGRRPVRRSPSKG